MIKNFKKKITSSILAVSIATLSSAAFAADLEKIHFIIPGGAGGGWDGTALGTGDVLMKENLVNQVSYQNLSGGGGKAIAHMIETAERQEDTLMVNSTPIVVAGDSKYTDWKQVVAAFKADPKSVKVAGGSARGSMDHLVAAAAFKGEGFDATTVRYIAYDAGGKAMAALLSVETPLLSTDLGEVLEMSKSGQVRIIAITAPERLSAAPNVPTLTEMGNDTVFANRRGFFAAPGVSKEKVAAWNKAFAAIYKTDQWATVRDRNGWIDNYKADKDFYNFLEEQEKVIGDLMSELGFLK